MPLLDAGGSFFFSMANDFRVLHAARSVRTEVIRLAERARPTLHDDKQLRDAVSSIPANIREAYGRRAGKERNQYLRVARSSAEETDEHLNCNFQLGRVSGKTYWSLHNRISTIVKMLNSLMGD